MLRPPPIYHAVGTARYTHPTSYRTSTTSTAYPTASASSPHPQTPPETHETGVIRSLLVRVFRQSLRRFGSLRDAGNTMMLFFSRIVRTAIQKSKNLLPYYSAYRDAQLELDPSKSQLNVVQKERDDLKLVVSALQAQQSLLTVEKDRQKSGNKALKSEAEKSSNEIRRLEESIEKMHKEHSAQIAEIRAEMKKLCLDRDENEQELQMTINGLRDELNEIALDRDSQLRTATARAKGLATLQSALHRTRQNESALKILLKEHDERERSQEIDTTTTSAKAETILHLWSTVSHNGRVSTFLKKACLSGNVINVFQDLKLRKRYRYIIYKMRDDLKEIAVEKTVEKAEYSDFVKSLPASECRYCVYDFQYDTSGECGRSEILFYLWSPDSSKLVEKLLYAASKDVLRKKLDGIYTVIQCTNLHEVSQETVSDKVIRMTGAAPFLGLGERWGDTTPPTPPEPVATSPVVEPEKIVTRIMESTGQRFGREEKKVNVYQRKTSSDLSSSASKLSWRMRPADRAALAATPAKPKKSVPTVQLGLPFTGVMTFGPPPPPPVNAPESLSAAAEGFSSHFSSAVTTFSTRKEVIEAKNRAKRVIHETEKAMGEFKDPLDDGEAEKIRGQIVTGKKKSS